MLQLSKNDKNTILKAIKVGKIDAADLSFPNLIDTIVLKMKNIGLVDKLIESFTDKRKQNKHILDCQHFLIQKLFGHTF